MTRTTGGPLLGSAPPHVVDAVYAKKDVTMRQRGVFKRAGAPGRGDSSCVRRRDALNAQ